MMTVPFLFLGNAAWLDFVNTEIGIGDERVELLTDFDALMRWGREAALLGGNEDQGSGGAGLDQSRRTAILNEALSLRAELRKAAGDLTRGRSPGSPLVDRVNKILGEHPIVLSLRRADGAWGIGLTPTEPGPRDVLARVAEDFARFMATADPRFLRRCANERCRIYFYDTSKNHTRRWCSMELCGNRAKVAGHRLRRSGRGK